ncbi:hypothetical protein [Pyramidobacter sp. CG50-2]|uniref:hypothetical protein n=1 Tax=Pyramidobacter sp. CG50-2 TaxID=2382160 RepID=UPI000EA35C20|nr:hypothetical protein [Pyramidobacter sp. CG50-2]RKJ81121.1 hypothetical protein D7D26_01340 [Pyramidobacter sp. CG50-2]
MKVQISLTVEAGKRLIAKAILTLPAVRRALAEGRLLLKGGTTVSLISEAVCGVPLKICGRIDRRGAGSCAGNCPAPHSLLLHRGVPAPLDAELWSSGKLRFSPGDACVIGANLVDRHGRAAMLAGSPFGGTLHFFTSLPAEGVEMIVAAGLEKYAPCSLDDAVAAASRLAPDLSMGMAAGLIPIPGRVINEAEACKILGAAEVQIVARGGIQGAEGGCTLLASFDERPQGEAFFNEILALSGTVFQKSAGDAKSLKSCLDTACGPTGAEHRGCWYRSRRRELPV